MNRSPQRHRVLVLATTTTVSPALRYRITRPLELAQESAGVVFRIVSFYSRRTERLRHRSTFLFLASLTGDVFSFGVLCLELLFQRWPTCIVKSYTAPIGGAIVERLSRRLLMRRATIYYDIDDPIHLSSSKSSFVRALRATDRKVSYWLRNAKRVLVCNTFIKEDLKAFLSKQTSPAIAAGVCWKMYTTYPEATRYFANVQALRSMKAEIPINQSINIVWLGSPYTAPSLLLMKDLINRLIAADPRVHVVLIGMTQFLYRKHFGRTARVQYVRWAPEAEIYHLQRAHFGLSPLLDTTMYRLKCAFKHIQYLRAGVYPIATPVGLNGELLKAFGGVAFTNTSVDSIVSTVTKMPVDEYQRLSEKMYSETQHLTLETNARQLAVLLMQKDDEHCV